MLTYAKGWINVSGGGCGGGSGGRAGRGGKKKELTDKTKEREVKDKGKEMLTPE